MDKKRYFRLIYQRAFRYLGAALVIALLTGALLGGGIYMVSAFCAAGFVMIAWGWFTYLQMTGMRFFQRRSEKPKVPYLHKRFKDRKPHRPSFRMDSTDFDDDLTSATMVSEELFTPKQRNAAMAIARAACGVVMVILSFFIPT